MIVKLTQQAIDAITWLKANFAGLRRLIDTGSALRGSGAARVSTSGGVTVVHVDPAAVSSTSVTESIIFADITGNATGGGYYTADFYRVRAQLSDPTSNLERADIVDATAKFASGYALNLQEVVANTHALTHASNANQKLFQCRMIPKAPDDKPVAILIGNAIWAEVCDDD